ncbi:helix-turn-helix transcriptional regulator [Eubacterium ramulus]
MNNLKNNEFFYENMRNRMIETMQRALKRVRGTLGYNLQDFAERLGVTRQTVAGWESGKTRISQLQYVAICGLIDSDVKDEIELFTIIAGILCIFENSAPNDVKIFQCVANWSFSKTWFNTFMDIARMNEIDNYTDQPLPIRELQYLASRYEVWLDESVLSQTDFLKSFEIFTSAPQFTGRQNKVTVTTVFNIENRREKLNTEVNVANENLQLLQNMEGVLSLSGKTSEKNEITALTEQMNFSRNVNNVCFVTADDNVAQAVVREMDFISVKADFTILKFIPGSGFIIWKLNIGKKMEEKDCGNNNL